MAVKKKLLYIVEAMGGGILTYIVDLSNKLIKEYDIYIAYGTRKQTPNDFRDYFNCEIHLIQVKNFERTINVEKDLKAFFEIKQIEKEIKPDIIHLHSSKAGVLGRFAFNGKKIPLYYTPHGYSFLMQNQSRVKRLIYEFIEKVSAMRNCTTISCSLGEHKETLNLTPRAYYVNNGINIQELEKTLNAIEKIKRNKFTVFTLGRICYQKNPKLFNEIAMALPEIDFMWIGDGELRDELTAPNIQILGWCDRKDALKKAISADVFILTSLWEGLPISLLEAMYMKKVCIVNDVIGNRDVIIHKYNGFVCKNVEEFVKALIEAKNGDTQNLVANAYKDIFEQYNTDIMAESYINLYSNSFSEKEEFINNESKA